MLDFLSHTASAFERCRRIWTAFECHRRLSTAFKRMQTYQWQRYINLGLLTLQYDEAFWDRIVLYLDILCSIISYPSFSPKPYRAITRQRGWVGKTWWNGVKDDMTSCFGLSLFTHNIYRHSSATFLCHIRPNLTSLWYGVKLWVPVTDWPGTAWLCW